jgi:cyclase
MFRPRIIPVLLLKKDILVKSVGFKQHHYIGDPINAVRIFNEQFADELMILDIGATKNKQVISLDIVKDIAEEAMMPFSVGGGIRELSQIRKIISLGVEKVIIGSYAIENPDFIRQAATEFGSSTIAVCIDIKKNFFGKQKIWTVNGSKPAHIEPLIFAQRMEENGAGEVIIQSIERDGQMNGYDIKLIKSFADNLSIPVVALGGAGETNDLKKAYTEAHATGIAAGSLFVYYGNNKGVLINYTKPSFLF